ncbi:hypothetical protein EVAR_8453_1 [Eumeta japonica]|uniref:Uncharacterized protein n=1 Tax=Eumeta variegata TaxID=151549 RepID=A0A4C1WF91_EUMVA|nr:hypothetical protein EVAR_8453_1 [Eumeta japonica]
MEFMCYKFSEQRPDSTPGAAAVMFEVHYFVKAATKEISLGGEQGRCYRAISVVGRVRARARGRAARVVIQLFKITRDRPPLNIHTTGRPSRQPERRGRAPT